MFSSTPYVYSIRFPYTLNDAANLVPVRYTWVCYMLLGKAATNFMMHSKLFLFSARMYVCCMSVLLPTSYAYRACVCSSAFRRVLKQRKLFRFYIIPLNGPPHCFVTSQYRILLLVTIAVRLGVAGIVMWNPRRKLDVFCFL